jgi:hypothetical protein
MCCILALTSLPELQTMWHHLAQKPQVLQQMFNAPYMKPFLEGLSANPQVAQQVSEPFHVNRSLHWLI